MVHLLAKGSVHTAGASASSSVAVTSDTVVAGGISGKPVDAAAAEDKAPVLLLLGTAAEDEAPVSLVLAHDSVPKKARVLDCALLVLLPGR